jgi:uncharacterized protein (TIGR02145 family)
MRSKLFYLVLALVITSAASVNGQVLIGENGTGKPHKGAILELSPGQNNLGLLLPNVQLSGDANEFVLKPGVENQEKQAAAGMLVYNTSYFLKGPGLYVWNGASWMPLRDPCPGSITDKRDGNWYCTGDFGAAGTWMTMNLRTKKAPNGDLLVERSGTVMDNTPSYYYPYNNPQILVSHPEYGLTYTWAAANYGEDYAEDSDQFAGRASTRQGICPDGWHLPSDYEWNQLEEVIANGAAGAYSSTGQVGHGTLTSSGNYRGEHGQKMKSKTAVNSTPSGGTSNGADSNGFNALLAGRSVGTSNYYGTRTYFWTSSTHSAPYAWFRSLADVESGVERYNESKYRKYSIRCKKNN